MATQVLLLCWLDFKLNITLIHNSSSDRLHVSNAVCKIGSEKHPNDGMECDYDRDNYHQAYHEIENFFILHVKTNLFNPFISLQKFRTDYTFYVFDLSKQKPTKASQPIRLEFKISCMNNVAAYVAYAFELTSKLLSFSSDGQIHFDLL